MAEEVTYVYLRLSAGARHSQVDFEEIERLAGGPGTVLIQKDARDASIYCLVLPHEIDPAQANRIVSALATTPYIDEAWHKPVALSEMKFD